MFFGWLGGLVEFPAILLRAPDGFVTAVAGVEGRVVPGNWAGQSVVEAAAAGGQLPAALLRRSLLTVHIIRRCPDDF